MMKSSDISWTSSRLSLLISYENTEYIAFCHFVYFGKDHFIKAKRLNVFQKDNIFLDTQKNLLIQKLLYHKNLKPNAPHIQEI